MRMDDNFRIPEFSKSVHLGNGKYIGSSKYPTLSVVPGTHNRLATAVVYAQPANEQLTNASFLTRLVDQISY